MKSQPQPTTQEVLAGPVERVTFHNDDSGFCVLRIKSSPDASKMSPLSNRNQRACKKEVYCVNRKATASIAIKPAINNNAIVTAILFALGLSFHDLRR
jgi:hypothetical protein